MIDENANKIEMKQNRTIEDILEVLKFTESLDNGIAFFDYDLRVLYFNETVADMYNVRPEVVVGHTLDNYFPDIASTQFYKDLQTSAQTRKSLIRAEYSPVYKVWIENGFFLLPEGIIHTTNDVSYRYSSGPHSDIESKSAKYQQKYVDLRAEIGIALASADKKLEDVFQECADAFNKHLKPILARIWLFNEKEEVLEQVAESGYPTDVSMLRFDYRKYMIGKVAVSKAAIFNDDLQNCEDFSDLEWAKHYDISSFAGFPLLVGDKLLGAFALYSRTKIPEDSKNTMGLIADLMAQGIVRRQTQTVLQNERDFFSTVMNTMVSLLIVVDSEGKIVNFNPACEKLFGYSFEELKGQYSWEYMAVPEETDEIKNLFSTFKPADFPYYREMKCPQKNGDLRDILWTAGVVSNEDGGIKYIISSGVDVTEKKHSEEILRKSELKWRTFFNSSLVGLAVTKLTGEIIEVNDKFLDLLGYSRREFEDCELNWQEISPPEYKEVQSLAVQQVLEKGYAMPFEKEYYRKDGSRMPVLIAVTGSIDNNYNEVVATYILDISQLKQTEKALHESEQMLMRSQKMEAIGRLAGGIAHDFNNLLTVISGYSELSLGRVGDNPILKHNLEEISKASNRAASLTRQLLAFSRKQILQKKIVNLNEVIVDMEKMLTRLIGEDVEFNTHLDYSLNNIEADPGQLEQVLMNLAVNAREAMPKGGKIYVGTQNVYLDDQEAKPLGIKTGPGVLLKFSDNGAGMNEEVKEKLFEPFFTTKKEGTGLGLSTVYGIVMQMGGSIQVKSAEQQGTEFSIYFPQTSLEEQVTESSIAFVPSNTKGETILIVEDEDMVRQLAFDVLSPYGYNLLTSSNGKQALEVVENLGEKIDLILTDVVMPEMNGISLIENVHKVHPDMNVLFMSGYTSLENDAYKWLLTTENFIQKPFSNSHLVRKVQNMLEVK